MKASVIIPTFGTRSEYLIDTLRTVKKQDFPADQYEILVIDNNPKSDVLPIVERVNKEITEGPQVKHIKELEIGATKARHTGAKNTKAEILVYIGDDVLAHPGWLSAIIEPFSDPQVACSGGKLIAQWDAPKPQWLPELKHMALGMLDLGSETKVLNGEQVWGDNMAVRKSVLFEVGGFNPDIYGYGDKNYMWLMGDAECGLEKKIYARKYKIVYEPRAWVYHRVPASRTTQEYFCRRSFVAAIGTSFTQVRKIRRSRILLPRLLLQSVWYFLKSGKLYLQSILTKENRVRSRVFAFHFYGKANHQLRAAFSQKLREHIFRDSYID